MTGLVGVGASEAEYQAAMKGAAIFVRRGRRFLEVSGRAPAEMLKGIVSGRIPEEPSERGDGMLVGDVSYSTLLTPKGRMMTDLRIFRDRDSTFLLDVPEVAFEGASAHLQRYLPPRLAKLKNRSHELAMLTMVGPDAVGIIDGNILDEETGSESLQPHLEALEEGQEFLGISVNGNPIRVVANGDVQCPAYDLVVSKDRLEDLKGRAVAAGATEANAATWEVLRIEGGRPVFGVDMTEDTIPLEAEIHHRAIDSTKGCYTGQEVIIRIRDRGHVNKSLRGFLLGDVDTPSSGSELFVAEESGNGAGAGTNNQDAAPSKSVGWITSACRSPRFGQTIALGYVRRSADAQEVLRIGGSDGPEARVRRLHEEGWG